jgi:hypothetical protein
MSGFGDASKILGIFPNAAGYAPISFPDAASPPKVDMSSTSQSTTYNSK